MNFNMTNTGSKNSTTNGKICMVKYWNTKMPSKSQTFRMESESIGKICVMQD